MNKVTIEEAAVEPVYEAGSWWMDNGIGGAVYLLTRHLGDYRAVDPATGVFLDGRPNSRHDAVAGLHFICASADVVVRPHGAKQPEPDNPCLQEDSDWAWYRRNCRRVDVVNSGDEVRAYWLTESCKSKALEAVKRPTFAEALRALREAVEGGEG